MTPRLCSIFSRTLRAARFAHLRGAGTLQFASTIHRKCLLNMILSLANSKFAISLQPVHKFIIIQRVMY